MGTVTCEWCGREHAIDALCVARTRWSRRGFLALFGAGVIGASFVHALPTPDVCTATYQIWPDVYTANYRMWFEVGRQGGKTSAAFAAGVNGLILQREAEKQLAHPAPLSLSDLIDHIALVHGRSED
jgi:hypothetical protein